MLTSTLSPLDWTRFPPTSIDRNSSYPMKIPKQHYFQLKFILPLVPTKYLRGFFAKNASTLHRPLSSIFNLSLRQGLALPCGNHLMFHQIQNLPRWRHRLRFPPHLPHGHCYQNSGVVSLPLAFPINHRTDRPSSVWRSTRLKREHSTRPPPP
jgi:hypothetical protein